MEGNYLVGLFGRADELDPKKNWFKMGFYDDLHDLSKTHCKQSILGDFCMYFDKISDIAYMATQTSMGYAITRKSWREI